MQTLDNKPDQSVCTTCPYCGVGCGIITSRQDQTITIKGDPDHPANYGRLCSKGAALAETLDLDDRLLYPEINGEQVDWETALQKVANAISEVSAKYGPDSIGFYVSGQLLTEDYYVANKLMKGFIGSANIDTNSRLCMSSAVAGYKRAFGADFVPCTYSDLEQADLLIITGSNTAWCHPVIYQRMVQAKSDNPKMKVVVIDPRKTITCDIADLHLPIKPGTDVALFNGLLSFLRREDTLDWDFLEKHTEGFAAALKSAKNDSPSIPHVANVCGLNELDLAEFYRLFLRTQKTVTLFSQGVNQSSRGTDKVNALINCHLATGRIGKTGMGPFSITGQPNAMGGREVGGLSNQLAAHMEIEEPVHRELVKKFWDTDTLPEKSGLKAVELFDAVDRGEIKLIWIMATNPVDSMPDADRIRNALKKCDTVIVSDCVRNTDTTVCADILLPALAWGEKDGTVTNSERRISRQRKFLEAPGIAKPDWWIITQVAHHLGFEDQFNYTSPAQIFREHARLSGFENNGSRDFDISAFADIDENGYEYMLPTLWPARKNLPAGNHDLTESHYYHPNKKAKLVAVNYVPPANPVDIEYPIILNTGRIRDHWHTMTRTGKAPRLSQHCNESFVSINPLDVARLQIANDQLVTIKSRWGSVVVRSRTDINQQPGAVFVPIHWTDQYAGNARIDSLVNPEIDALSGQPELKHTPVNIEPLTMAWQGFLITRQPLKNLPVTYWSCYRGYGYREYELAAESIPANWSTWAAEILQKDELESDWLEYSDASIGRYRAADIRNGKLESCLFIARDFTHLPDRNWLQGLFREHTMDKVTRACLLAGKSTNRQTETGPVVCSCFGVGKNTIIQTILEKNLTDVSQIGECIQAGTNCGSCIPEIRHLLSKKSISDAA